MSMGGKRGKARPTIRDVAAAAGVSATTVSQSLNNKGRVDPNTRKRVIDVAVRIGYTPSQTARNLRGGRTSTLSLVLPALGSSSDSNEALSLDIYMRMATSAASVAHSRGYGMLLLPPVSDPDDLGHAPIDGAVVVDPDRNDPRLGSLQRQGIPFVTIERDPTRDYDRHVSLAIEDGLREAIEHLIAQGASRINLLASDADWTYSSDASRAFIELCYELSVEASATSVPVLPLEGGAYTAASRALDSNPRPDAIIALVERFAMATLRAARERNLAIPGDLLLISGADSFNLREASPTVTALDMQPEKSAAAAVEMLIGVLQGETVTAPRLIPYPLVVRESSVRN